MPLKMSKNHRNNENRKAQNAETRKKYYSDSMLIQLATYSDAGDRVSGVCPATEAVLDATIDEQTDKQRDR